MRGATCYCVWFRCARQISTHTPHAGRDTLVKDDLQRFWISTHTPHAGRDPADKTGFNPAFLFLLTRPMRGATRCQNNDTGKERFLLTRPMRGATEHTRIRKQTKTISTHTPHAGRDEDIVVWSKGRYISTHTPHAGRDDRPDCRAMDGK